MRRAASLLLLLASACSMEPAYVRPDPAIPASWPVGDPYLAQAEVGLPILTYQQVFTDPRLQTLISEALVNNRDLMIAASNIAAAREQYRIQRAALLPTVQAAPKRAICRASTANGIGPLASSPSGPVALGLKRGRRVTGVIASARSAQNVRALATVAACPAHRPRTGRPDSCGGASRSRAAAHGAGPGRQCAPAAGRHSDRPEATPRIDRRGVWQNRAGSDGP